MSLMENSGTLSRAAKDLFARWNDVNAIWNDTQSEEFEKSCLEPLRQDIRAAGQRIGSIWRLRELRSRTSLMEIIGLRILAICCGIPISRGYSNC